MLISDGHSHTSPNGLGAKVIAKKFKESNGWFMALVSLPPYHYGLSTSLDDLIKSFEIHMKQCSIARSEGIKIACIIGLHPAFIDRLVKQYQSRRHELLKYIDKSIRYIEGLVKEGKIDGLGEFGRPHYKTLPESFALNDYVLLKVLSMVNDYSIPIHLHLEEAGIITTISMDSIINKVLSNSKYKYVVFHHATKEICISATSRGFSATIVGKAGMIKNVLEAIEPKYAIHINIESDYIDDPKRPGIVMYPWELRLEVSKVLSEDPSLENILSLILIDSITNIYGINPP